MQNSIVTLKNVNKFIGVQHESIQILRNVDLDIDKGEFIVIMGENPNRRVLLNIVSASETQSSGEVMLFNRPLKSLSSWDKDLLRNYKIGVVNKNGDFFYNLTVYENLLMALDIERDLGYDEKKKTIEDILDKLNLKWKKSDFAYALTKEEQKRLSLARALIKNPEILLLDNAAQELKPEEEECIATLLKSISKEGKAIVIFSKNERVVRYADKLYKLDTNGELNRYF